MEAILLAGGLGTRLKPHTIYFNKHLLPVYDVPMIYFSLNLAVNSNVSDLIVCLSGNQSDIVMDYITKNWENKFNSISFVYDPEVKGTGYSLKKASHLLSGKEPILVVCCDNVFDPNFTVINEVKHLGDNGSHIFLAKTDKSYNRGSYVKLELEHNRVKDVIRTSEEYYPEYIMAGIAIYNKQLKEVIDYIDISRTYDIFEITSYFCKNYKCLYSIIDTWWFDAGTYEGLYKATSTYRKWKLGEL